MLLFSSRLIGIFLHPIEECRSFALQGVHCGRCGSGRGGAGGVRGGRAGVEAIPNGKANKSGKRRVEKGPNGNRNESKQKKATDKKINLKMLCTGTVVYWPRRGEAASETNRKLRLSVVFGAGFAVYSSRAVPINAPPCPVRLDWYGNNTRSWVLHLRSSSRGGTNHSQTSV